MKKYSLIYILIFFVMLSCGDNKDLPEDYYDVDRNREELYEDILKDSNILLDYDDYLYENLACSLVIEIIDKNYPKPENNPAFKSYELNDSDFYDLEKVPEEIKNQVIATVYYRTKLLTSDTMYEFCDLSQMDEWGDDYLSRYTDWTFLLWEVGIDPNELCYFGKPMQDLLSTVGDYC